MSTMREKFSQWLGANSQHVDSVTEQFMFEAWQAATEAAKATGTAELPPSDGVIEFYEESGRIGRSWTESAWLEQAVREYGQACAEAVLCAPDGESWQHKFEETDRALLYWKAKAKQAEAARQPAPVPGLPFADLATPIKEFEARKAALAATAAPVLSDERIDWLANCACPGGVAYPSQVKAAIRDALREASTNKVQP